MEKFKKGKLIAALLVLIMIVNMFAPYGLLIGTVEAARRFAR